VGTSHLLKDGLWSYNAVRRARLPPDGAAAGAGTLMAPALQYYLAAEALACALAALAWLRVWREPGSDRLRIAALASAGLLTLKFLRVSVEIVIEPLR